MSAVPGGDTNTATPGLSLGVLSERARARLIGLALAIVCALPLGIGAWLTPSPTGMGTHRAIGLPPCGFLLATGRPCMTCGMTTAVTLATQGRLVESAKVQPAGALVAIVLASGLVAGLHALAAGVTLRPILDAATNTRTLIATGVMLGAAWGYKVWIESIPSGATATVRQGDTAPKAE